jgi:protein TonB
MAQLTQERRDRIKSAVAVAALHAMLGYALMMGLGFNVAHGVSENLKLFDVSDDPPPPPPLVEPAKTPESSDDPKPKDPEGAASPPNLKDTPSPVVAPVPKVRLPVPPPVTAAPVTGQGNAVSMGAAEVRGPGTGSGGIGTGSGSGISGNGGGGGGGGGTGLGGRARWISGGIDPMDYPEAAIRARASGTVGLRFVVGPSGRVTDCAVTRSSGVPSLDKATCRLILRRFRYRPARDDEGRPTSETVVGKHEWVYEERETLVIEEPDIEE